MAECGGNSRGGGGITRLMKSCFPNTQPENTPHIHLIRRPISVSSSGKQQTTTLNCLPNDLLLECLLRLPVSSFSSVSLVCRHWSNLVNSPSLYHLRRSGGLLAHNLFALSVTSDRSAFYVANHSVSSNSTSWSINPIRDLPIEFPDRSLSHSRLIAIERHIYILNRNFTLRYDTWTARFASRSPMLFPRKKFAAAEISGRIYISGGAGPGAAAVPVEEYDPETDTWRISGWSTKRRYGCIGVGVEGIFYVIGGLKINSSRERERCCSATTEGEAREYGNTMDLFEVETGLWLRSRWLPSGGCVVAACVVGTHIYALTSHAVEVSFWRYDGSNRHYSSSWCRMKTPPLPPQVRVDNSVRFACVGVGEDKVVLIQVLGSIDDLLTRSGRSGRGFREGLTLVYDCGMDEWGRHVDLPPEITRAACVCVNC